MINEILHVALSNYGHIIPMGEKISPDQFLENFRKTYSLDNIQNRNVYTVVAHMADKIEYFEHSLDGNRHLQFKPQNTVS